jgi:probable HAF family extracellular repeat protein
MRDEEPSYAKWIIERVESVSKNRRFIFGRRLAEAGGRQGRRLPETEWWEERPRSWAGNDSLTRDKSSILVLPMFTPTQTKLTKRLSTILATTAVIGGIRFSSPLTQASPPQYTLTDLGTLGGIYSSALGINASGQVVGQSFLADSTAYHAVRWDGTTATDLGAALGNYSTATGINASGQVVGSLNELGDRLHYHAVRWDGNTPTDLGTLGGDYSSAYAINTAGQIVGFSEVAGAPIDHAVRWDGDTVTALDVPGGGYSAAFGINDLGQIVGESEIGYAFGRHAVSWLGNTVIDLGTLGGDYSAAFGINASGQIVGSAEVGGQHTFHAVRWDGTIATDLGALSDAATDYSAAFAINASGQIVGYSSHANGDSSAFLYSEGVMYDLNTLLVNGSGVSVIDARAINDLGQIAGWGSINGQIHGFRLDPLIVPEPTSVLLLLSGISLLGLRRRRLE